MSKRVLLSHNHADREIASILSRTISRVTLGQLTAWYSSDQSGSGGMRAGDLWMPTLLGQLRECDGAIALLTPRSIRQPWLYFESGFVAARESGDVIPVCVGIDSINDVPFPLAMFQSYQVTDPSSMLGFLQKLTGRYGIGFDEEMARPVATSAIAALSEASAMQPAEPAPRIDTPLVDQIKEHIDRRFIELARHSEQQATADRQHTVPLTLRFPGLGAPDFLVIRDSASVQDVLDTVYLMLEAHVKEYTYQQAWILIETTSRNPLAAPGGRSFDDHASVRHERRWIFQDIPARYVFRPGTKWEAYALNEPYCRDHAQVCYPDDD